ncbi:type II toxin-antitoxin system RelE/ParE family toxin [Nocardia sp. NPDC057455]
MKKLSGHHDLFRLRVGRYRVAYRVDNGVLVILVVEVGRRKDVYRGL